MRTRLWKPLFRFVLGITGICEAILGLLIVFLAGSLQSYLSPGILPEPLYLRIIGMMDFWIGVLYLQIARQPEQYVLMNKWTSWLRLGLSFVFVAEGFWLLDDPTLRWIFQTLALFDLFLFVTQTLYVQKGG